MPKALSSTQLSAVLAAIISVIPFAIDAYLPALATMAVDLGHSLHALELTISSFFVGYALGSLVGGPLSDHYGRRAMAVFGLALFTASSIAMALSDSYHSLLVLRFVQAFGGGMTTVVVPAIVRDRFERQEAAKVMTTIAFIMMAAPLSAPVVGAVILNLWGWRAIFVFLALYATALIALARLYLPQSRDPAQPPPPFSLRDTLRNYRHILCHAQARPYLLACICSSAVFLSYLTQAAYLFNEYLGLNSAQFPIAFSIFVVSLMIANRGNAYLLRRRDSRTVFVWGVRLTLACTAGLLLAALLSPPGSYLVPLGVLLSISSLALINSNAQSNFLHYFADMSGAASSLQRASEMVTGALAGALVSALYTGSPAPLAAVMFGASALAFVTVQRAAIVAEDNAAN